MLTDRAVIRVSPTSDEEDAFAFLQGLLTNDVTGDLPVYAALLSAQGKTMFDMIVWRDGKDALLDCEAGVAEALAKRLSLYRLRRALTIAVDTSLAVCWSAGPMAGAAPDPRLAALGYRRIDKDAAGGEPADEAYRAQRLSLGVPEGQAELSDILWLETNAVELNGVSFSQGCYIGQENTARMNWRQKINRRLIVVPLEQSDEKRRKAAYPDLNLAVDHLRTDAIAPDLQPAWLSEPEQA